MSAPVCHSKDDEVAAVHPKIDPEGKPAHNCATDFTMNQRKPRRVRCDALEGLVNGVREPRAKSRPLLFVPLPRRAGFFLGLWSKDDRMGHVPSASFRRT
jgi:hypothetical protein